MNLAKIRTTLPAGYANPAQDPTFQHEILPGQTESAAMYKLNSSAVGGITSDPTAQTDNFHKLCALHRQVRDNMVPKDGSFPLHVPKPFIHTNILKHKEHLVQQAPRSVVRDGNALLWTLQSGEKMLTYCQPEDDQFVPGP